MIKIPMRFTKMGIWIFSVLILLGIISDTRIFATENDAHYKIISYLPLWEKWHANDIAMKELTHINLAFAGIKDGVIVGKITPDQINTIHQLKYYNRQLKVLICVGGWGVEGFSDAALTEDSREKFAASVALYLQKYKLDGIDIDWEFPGNGGGIIKDRPEDTENFSLMMQVLRATLDNMGYLQHRHYILSFAGNVSSHYIKTIELNKLIPLVDYINLMTYDFHGAWEQSTGFHTNLYTTPEDPIAISADQGAKLYLQAGVPPEKIILGTAFYGYYWTGVTNVNNGRYQPANGICKTYSYKYLCENFINRNGFLRYWDDQAKAPYLWNGDTFITYEDEESLGYRTMYIRANRLGGVMIWQYCQDLNRTLLNKIYRELSY